LLWGRADTVQFFSNVHSRSLESLMKSFLATLVAVVAMSTAFAQAPPPRPDPQKFLDRLTIVLDLDDAQKVQVKEVLDTQRAKMEAQRAQFKASGERPTWEQMRAAHEQAKTETKSALSQILNADQMKKYDAFMADRDRGPPPGGPPPGMRGEHPSSSSSSNQ
jgi:hypothetical protein